MSSYMNELRWILTVCGVLLLIGIYFWGRSGDKKTKTQDALSRNRAEPQLQPAARFEPSLAQDLGDEPEPYAEEDVPEVEEPLDIESDVPAWQAAPEPQRPVSREPRRGRVEPTFTEESVSATLERPTSELTDETLTAELPVQDSMDAPTLGMSSSPAPRRIERRKIVALRLAATAQRFPGQQLRDALEAEGLQHGKYDVFHRSTEDGASVFSVASMVEPGTFDLERMGTAMYPGVTLFAQLPGPIPGAHAVQELVACGKRLQEALGGTLQDERGVPLTVHRTERLRQEVVDFEKTQPREVGRGTAPPPV
jgi:cell division protein ZipA